MPPITRPPPQPTTAAAAAAGGTNTFSKIILRLFLILATPLPPSCLCYVRRGCIQRGHGQSAARPRLQVISLSSGTRVLARCRHVCFCVGCQWDVSEMPVGWRECKNLKVFLMLFICAAASHARRPGTLARTCYCRSTSAGHPFFCVAQHLPAFLNPHRRDTLYAPWKCTELRHG